VTFKYTLKYFLTYDVLTFPRHRTVLCLHAVIVVRERDPELVASCRDSQQMTTCVSCRNPGSDGSWVLQYWVSGNDTVKAWAVQVQFFLQLTHPRVQHPLLLVIGDPLQGSADIPEAAEDLATFRIECKKDNWSNPRNYPMLLQGVSAPLIYLPFQKNGVDWLAFNKVDFSSGRTAPAAYLGD
jgi:hypothetical protein